VALGHGRVAALRSRLAAWARRSRRGSPDGSTSALADGGLAALPGHTRAEHDRAAPAAPDGPRPVLLSVSLAGVTLWRAGEEVGPDEERRRLREGMARIEAEGAGPKAGLPGGR
jgi:hypothetical protein